MSIHYAKASLVLTTATQVLYTVPASVDTAIVSFGVCNNTGADTGLSLYVVDSGDTESTANQYITNKTVTSAAINPLDAITGMVLETGDYIVANAGIDGIMNIRIGVMEIANA